MILVDRKEFRIAVHGRHQRPRVVQRVAERLLADYVDVRCLREHTVLAMKPRHREDVDEVEARLVQHATMSV